MRISDTVLGGGLVIFAIVLAGYAQTFPDIPGQRHGAALFPSLVALGFAGCGLALVAGEWRARAPAVTWPEWAGNPRALAGVVATIVGLVVYILLARTIGFVPMMIALLLALFALLRVRWWVALIAAIAATFIIEKVFVDFLLVPLPLGIMPRLPW